MAILENISLALHTTFKIGGAARYFCAVSSVTELREAIAFASKQSVPFFVLGWGSNLLVGDAGFSGLVIKNEIKGTDFEKQVRDEKQGQVEIVENDVVYVTVGAGEGWDELVAKTVEKGLWGLENLSLIPGTVGASPVQNIGAYGVEVGDYIESVHVLDTSDTEKSIEKTFSNSECHFGYRDSMFKRPESKKYIITTVTFRLSTKPDPKLLYKDLREYFAGKTANSVIAATHPSQSAIRDAVIAIRTGKFPDLSVVGTAGSFWKNPIITRTHFEKLKTTWPNMPSFPVDSVGVNVDANPKADGDYVKVPLAYILDAVCGLKGFTKGDVRSSVGLFHKQPLVVVAEKGASASDVEHVAQFVASRVKEKTGISIEREVEYLGF